MFMLYYYYCICDNDDKDNLNNAHEVRMTFSKAILVENQV